MAADGVDPLTAPLPRSLARRGEDVEPGNVIELPENYLRRMAVALERLAAAVERWVDGADEVEEPGTPLPGDFPGREALAEAGVVYYEMLPRKGAELAALGLDGPTVNQVLVRLKRDG